MRRTTLESFVTSLVEQTWDGDDAAIAEAILDDDAFGALCYRLNEVGDGNASEIGEVWVALIEGLDDHTIDWLADGAENPAAYLCSQI